MSETEQIKKQLLALPARQSLGVAAELITSLFESEDANDLFALQEFATWLDNFIQEMGKAETEKIQKMLREHEGTKQ